MADTRAPRAEQGLSSASADAATVDAPPPRSIGSEPSRYEKQAAAPPPVASPEDELPCGATVGRYVVLNRLGAGGMGIVYAAYDPELDRKVALKLLRTRSAGSEGQHSRIRLLREAQAMARLSHPNVVTVYDVGTAFEQVFVAMEFVDGGTLREWLRQPRTQKEILEIFYLAGCGLAAAHKSGLVHRDFKPDNVLIGRDGRVRVTDFGLVRTVSQPEDAAAAGADPGTPESAGSRSPADTHPAGQPSSGVGSSQLLDVPLTQVGALLGTVQDISCFRR